MLELKGKRVLVTGGSRGIGRAIVLAFAEAGATVHTCYRNDSADVENLRETLTGYGAEHTVSQVDVADPAQVQEFVEAAAKRDGGIDVIVNNAGVVSHSTLQEMDVAEWNRVLNTNLGGVMSVVKSALPSLCEGASIVTISSAVASIGMVGRTHYTASKSALVGFSRSLCKELGPLGIRVNLVAPGIIETDQTAGLTPEIRERYSKLAALGRLGEPDDIASVVLFLASDLSRFVSGQTIVVDGGI
nr:SDR family NAD(P)-dependent oxidoreductase [Kibdelosporangium sp. MJ126-NF4]CEL19955.1 3-oxoacyl-[acyl-carrier protein] reductase [Kibdelosporangium sp. MJ126-NF4]CTQ97179.1 3-oxoacyl-[acyl-carrier protein] reductase (EC 1.1.1.100) [Kibdelosporangium sp. MJ126-NF4]